MKNIELLNRYEGHPLGAALKSLNEAKSLNVLHDMYIASKSMALLLKHQGEITSDELDQLEQYVESRVNAHLPDGKPQTLS